MNLLLINLNPYEWLAISTLITVITYYYLKWTRIFSYWKFRNIATPPPYPFFGNNFDMMFRPRSEIELEWYAKYGKIFGVYFGDKPALTVAEPELIKQVLVKDFHLFRNRRDNGSRHKILSKIMFTARDDDWKRIRAIASPTFTSGKLKKMYALINKCCTDFLEDLEEKVVNQKEIELKQLMGTYTMDVIARCAFASKPNTYKDSNNEFTTRATKIFTLPIWKVFLLTILPTVISRNQKIRRLINSSENFDFFSNFAAKVMKYRRDNNEKHNDFLQLLMDVERNNIQMTEESDANESHHINEGTDELRADMEALSDVIEKKLTENEILAQCFLFFIAGFETTATTLSFCTYELALHPEIQQRLNEETREAFDEKGEINYDVLSKLPFLDAVISETLRNYPPVLRLEREAMEDVILGDSGIKIEKGVVAEIPVYAIHHDSDNYPDPLKFNPDRFMPENRDNIKPYTYIPFGAGPRNCIGMRFALLEAKLALAKLSQKFIFSRVAATDIPLKYNQGRFLLQTKQLIVGIEKR